MMGRRMKQRCVVEEEARIVEQHLQRRGAYYGHEPKIEHKIRTIITAKKQGRNENKHNNARQKRI